MAWYIYDSFGVVVSPQTIATELRVAGWSRKLVSYILNIDEEITHLYARLVALL